MSDFIKSISNINDSAILTIDDSGKSIGNIIPIITDITNIPNHYVGFLSEQPPAENACKWCGEHVCTDPICVKELRAIEENSGENKCTLCWMEFDTVREAEWHMQYCKTKTQLYCGCCSEMFETRQQLDKHDKEKCWNACYPTPFECSCCGNGYNTQAELDAHDEQNCWNEDAISRMQDYHDPYQDELDQLEEEQERLADFREQMREQMRASAKLCKKHS